MKTVNTLEEIKKLYPVGAKFAYGAAGVVLGYELQILYNREPVWLVVVMFAGGVRSSFGLSWLSPEGKNPISEVLTFSTPEELIHKALKTWEESEMVDDAITEQVEYEIMRQDQNTGRWQLVEGFKRRKKMVDGTFLWIFPWQYPVYTETPDEQIARAVNLARSQFGVIGIFKKIISGNCYYEGPDGKPGFFPIWKNGTWL